MKHLFLIGLTLIGCQQETRYVEVQDDDYCFDKITNEEPTECDEVCWHMLNDCTVGAEEGPRRNFSWCTEYCEIRGDLKCAADGGLNFTEGCEYYTQLITTQRQCILSASNLEECIDCNYYGE